MAARFRVTVEPPDDSDEPARSFVTLPLEPIEIRSVIFAATRLLTRQGWSVRIERLPDDP